MTIAPILIQRPSQERSRVSAAQRLVMSGRRPLQPTPTTSHSCGGPLLCLARKRRLRIRARPTLLSVPAEGRIDNETAKRIDQGHVERSETTHGLHVDCHVERVSPDAWRESECQEGMHGRIAKLAEGFLTQDVEHSKRALASPRSNLRLRAIGFSKAIDVRSAGRIMALVIPSERSAEGPSQPE